MLAAHDQELISQPRSGLGGFLRVLQRIEGLFLVLLLTVPAHSATPRTHVAKVERVSDGDTITAFTSEGTKLCIRLLGIDALEIAHGTIPRLR